LELSRENGAEVIWATISIEKRIDEIIAFYLFGSPANNPEYGFFVNEILHSNYFPFSHKKEIVIKIMMDVGIFQDQDQEKEKIQKSLKKIMDYRNAFAHGRFTADSKNGSVLSYYSGGNKSLCLNKEFWETVEQVYRETHNFLDKTIKILKDRRTSFNS